MGGQHSSLSNGLRSGCSTKLAERANAYHAAGAGCSAAAGPKACAWLRRAYATRPGGASELNIHVIHVRESDDACAVGVATSSFFLQAKIPLVLVDANPI